MPSRLVHLTGSGILIPDFATAAVPAAGLRGRLIRQTDGLAGLRVDDGSAWNTLLPALDPRDFGAVGDGTTDNTTAFWNLAIALEAAGGGSVCLPPNCTFITERFPLPSNTHVFGVGASSVLKRKASSTYNGALITADTMTGIVLENFAIDGNRANNSETVDGGTNPASHGGIWFGGCTDCRIHGIQVYSSNSYGILGYNCTGLFIGQCHSWDHVNSAFPANPLEIGLHLGSDCSIIQCSAHDSSNSGFVVSEMERVSCHGLNAYGNGGYGIEIYAGSGQHINDITLAASTFKDNDVGGILVGPNGATWDDIYGITVVGNLCIANTHGVNLCGSHCVLSGNVVRDSKQLGIYRHGGSDNTIIGNIIAGGNTDDIANFSAIHYENYASSRDQLLGNTVLKGSGHQKYALWIEGTNVVGLNIGQNNFSQGYETAAVHDGGSGTVTWTP